MLEGVEQELISINWGGGRAGPPGQKHDHVREEEFA